MKSDYVLNCQTLNQLSEKENRLVVLINHISIEKENKVCSLSAEQKVAILKQAAYSRLQLTWPTGQELSLACLLMVGNLSVYAVESGQPSLA